MKFPRYLVTLSNTLKNRDSAQLAELLRARGDHADELLKNLETSDREYLQAHYGATIKTPWNEIAIAHVQVIVHLMDKNYVAAYKEQVILAQAFLRYIITQTNWVITALYVILRDLRNLALEAVVSAYSAGSQFPQGMEEAARICNKAFTTCVTDRTNKPEDSRKWGTYYVVGLVLKCYFKVNKTSLSRNIIRALEANHDIPPLEQYPRHDQVTYKYYLGLLSFLNEEYKRSEEDLTFAFYNCYRDAVRNQELILTYLIPLRLLRGQLPSEALFKRYPRLAELYTPFVEALRKSDIKAYDAALAWAEPRLLDMGVWLTVERAREICLRCLFRKVWLITGQGTRIPLSTFHTSLRVSGLAMPIEETECIIANMIHKGYMKGYISHEKQMVVLSSKDPFPNLGDRKAF
ncbi:hypothetical protein BOTBODRAFT_27100 [Botryobasidium botryosum FD-172 SS1]|uniref:PCI domain-containing protein n=1 Tax=Botryobasidium botryosum (strain FD-172 SS1) TaxID=930990 RepID=A0A067MZQ3_BOTB1|nr:hypothetical protein BOTBODRAFT_27100 [Botryobasidium botryosum FD-172 SS1]